MEILDLKLNNFGIFRGNYVFDLRTESKEKPVVLIGGLNGSGKTTLFDSIKVCLYGRLYLSGSNKKKYEKFITSRIVPLNSINKEKYTGSIEINFVLNEFGKSDYYTIKRTWVIQDELFDEKLNILKNSNQLEEVESEYSQAFLLNLIPRGVADLFIFDGEKIQELTENNTENEFFKEALDSILGLDIIDKLIDDLKKYSFKQNLYLDRDKEQKDLEKLIREKNQVEMNLENFNQERSQFISLKENVISKISDKEFELTNHGGGYAKKRTQVKNKLDKTQRRVHYLRGRLNSLYSGLFPFILCEDLCLELKKELLLEKNNKSKLTSLQVLLESRSEFEKRFTAELLLHPLEKISKTELIESIFKNIKVVLSEGNRNDLRFVADFSENELDNVVHWIDEAVEKVPEEILMLKNKLNKASNLREKLEGYLSKIPDDSLLTPIVQDLNKLYENKGLLEAKVNEKDTEINVLEQKLKKINENIIRVENNLEKVKKLDRKIDTIHNVQKLLKEYRNTIRELKVSEFEENLLSSLSMLLRKQDFVGKVKVDTENFGITLKRSDDSIINEDSSSNGEKQVMAIGILLALAKITKKSLPFIIDTPLARLDSNHRENIVNKFFPEASHQVIIFSTDTEIDEKFYCSLQPSLTRSYHLIYDPSTLSSKVEAGYFDMIGGTK